MVTDEDGSSPGFPWTTCDQRLCDSTLFCILLRLPIVYRLGGVDTSVYLL